MQLQAAEENQGQDITKNTEAAAKARRRPPQRKRRQTKTAEDGDVRRGLGDAHSSSHEVISYHI